MAPANQRRSVEALVSLFESINDSSRHSREDGEKRKRYMSDPHCNDSENIVQRPKLKKAANVNSIVHENDSKTRSGAKVSEVLCPKDLNIMKDVVKLNRQRFASLIQEFNAGKNTNDIKTLKSGASQQRGRFGRRQTVGTPGETVIKCIEAMEKRREETLMKIVRIDRKGHESKDQQLLVELENSDEEEFVRNAHEKRTNLNDENTSSSFEKNLQNIVNNLNKMKIQPVFIRKTVQRKHQTNAKTAKPEVGHEKTTTKNYIEVEETLYKIIHLQPEVRVNIPPAIEMRRKDETKADSDDNTDVFAHNHTSNDTIIMPNDEHNVQSDDDNTPESNQSTPLIVHHADVTQENDMYDYITLRAPGTSKSHLGSTSTPTSSPRSSDEIANEEDDFQYVNQFDVMRSGIVRQSIDIRNDEALYDYLPYLPQRGVNETLQFNSDEDLDDDGKCAGDTGDTLSVTITTYDPVLCGSLESLHYKTLWSISNNQLVQASGVSKVKLSKNRDESEEVQSFKNKEEYIIDELIQTEEYYVSVLQCALINYEEWLQQRIGIEKTRRIFINLQQIYEGTQAMLKEIREKRDDYEGIASIFVKNKNLFERYPLYCRSKKQADEICVQYQQMIIQREKDLFDKLGLFNHLLLPVQRLAKYELLLSNLLRTLEKAQQCADNVRAALELIKSISLNGNDLIELDLIRNRPCNIKKTGNLVMRDSFRMQQPHKKDIVLFLFKKKLFITKKHNNKEDNVIFLTDMDLDEIQINPEPKSPSVFTLSQFPKFQSQKVYYRLDAKYPEVKARWVTALQNMLWEQLIECKKTTTQQYADNHESTC